MLPVPSTAILKVSRPGRLAVVFLVSIAGGTADLLPGERLPAAMSSEWVNRWSACCLNSAKRHSLLRHRDTLKENPGNCYDFKEPASKL